MEFEGMQKIDRPTWRRYLFYVDLAVIAIFVISLVLLVRHSFEAGQFFERGEFSTSTSHLWLVVADTVFLVGSLGWIFYRFFRNQYLVITRRF